MIYKTITNEYAFANWVAQSGDYSNNFTVQGAKALQAYLDELSDELGENFEFDPIAWCVEYSEYKDVVEAYDTYSNGDTFTLSDTEKLEWLQDRTTVIEFDGGIIVQDF